MDAADERRGELDDRAQEINESIAVSNENPPTSDALEWNGVFDLNPRSLQYLKDHYKDNPPEFLSVPTPGYGYDRNFGKKLFLPKNHKNGIPVGFTE
ncbi:MAG: hypothetical protein Q9203_001706 [Teloschistes exilis]